MADVTAKLAEALRRTHEQLQNWDGESWSWINANDAAIEALAAYAQAQAEPFAFVHKRGADDEEFIHAEAVNAPCPDCEPLFLGAAPVAQAATPAPAPHPDTQDAERYRWLRERYQILTNEMPAKALGLDLRRLYVNTREKFDAAIDAARAGQGKEASNG